MRIAGFVVSASLCVAADLPKVLIIGDSISIGYTPHVKTLLAAKADVVHNEGNAEHTRNGLQKLEGWLGSGKWSVVSFNFGLHDLKIMKGGRHQVGLEEYAKNLEAIASRLKKTGARLVFINTTPVPDEKLSPLRKSGDEIPFNRAAKQVMSSHGIPVLDLESAARAKLAEIQTPANVHFTPQGYEYLATHVAKAIEERLK